MTAKRPEPILGTRIDGPPITCEADHFYTCKACGQAVDMWDLDQVPHHAEPGHEPLDMDQLQLYRDTNAQRDLEQWRSGIHGMSPLEMDS